MPAPARAMVTGILFCSWLAGQAIMLGPYMPLSTPHVAGTKTPTGLRITSTDTDVAFAIAIEGREIKPLDPDHLRWVIDGIDVELTAAKRQILVPAPDDSAKRLEQFRAWAVARDPGRPQPSAPAEPFACGSGRACLLWSQPEAAGKQTWTAATTSGDILVVLEARSVLPSQTPRVRQFLTKTSGTIEFGSIAAAPGSTVDKNNGTDIQQQLRMLSAMTAIDFTALVNSNLATPRDAKVAGVVLLDQSTMVELVKLLAGIMQPLTTTMSVFDGALAHAINLDSYDRPARQIHYWDPWGQGSFLQHANNRAGVNAVQNPTKPRIWIVSEQDFGRVIYSVVCPTSTVYAIFRMGTALAGDPDRAVEWYRQMKSQPPPAKPPKENPFNAPETSDEFLKSIQTYLASANRTDQAAVVARIRSALNSATPTDSANGSVPGRLPVYSPFNLEAAKKTDFFTWFHLEQSGPAAAEGAAAVLDFKPGGPAFHNLVDVNIFLENDAVPKVSLVMDHAFMSGQTVPFASDFARSFLAFTLPDAKSGPIAELKTEIDKWWRSDRTFVPVPGAAVPTKLPSMPSPAYMVYLGGGESYALPLANGRLLLENVRQNDKSRLRMTIEKN